MILVDPRTGSGELEIPIRRLGIPVEKTTLDYGDVCFEGRGPNGSITVGVERKKLHDMLNCIDDARYSGHQRIGMKQVYDVSVLMIEGHWRPHDPNGVIMEGYHGGVSWGPMKPRGKTVAYSKLYRYLLSLRLSGVLVETTRDMFQTCYNIHEWFHYFQKPWTGHTSLMEMQKVIIPTLNHKPRLVRKWASDLEGIGTKLSEDADKYFKTGFKLATADETDWVKLPGVGIKTAQAIVREIMGK